MSSALFPIHRIFTRHKVRLPCGRSMNKAIDCLFESPDQIRQERPVLWLGIRYATSILAAERKQLDQKLRAVFAQKIVVEGERSMDLLQGLIVFLAWYDKC